MANQLKGRIKKNFSSAVDSYSSVADVQKETARRLANSIKPWKYTIPVGPVLELGCGTGFFTRQLEQLFPERTLEITDLSEEMVHICKEGAPDRNDISFRSMDAENLPRKKKYPCIVHNFVAQWFKDPAYTMEKVMEQIKPGGLMVASFPGEKTFPEWREQCRKLDIPFTGNKLPEVEEMVIKLSMGPHQVDFYEDTITQNFNSALEFFRMLHALGAHTSFNDDQMNTAELRKLISHWDSKSDTEEITVSWHIVFLAVKKDT